MKLICIGLGFLLLTACEFVTQEEDIETVVIVEDINTLEMDRLNDEDQKGGGE